MILPLFVKELSKKPYVQHLAGNRKGLMDALEQFCFFISNKLRDEEIEHLKKSAVKAAASLRKKQPIFFLKLERALLSQNKLFSYVITAHTYVAMASDLDNAWERLAKHSILQENLLEHMLKKLYSDYPSAISISYQQVVDILLCFHLVARITKEAWFCEEECPLLPDNGDVFIVPSLVPRDTSKIPPGSDRERIIYFVFENGFVPVSLLNQLIVDCICHNVQRRNRLLWLKHGKVGLQLGSHQKYYISHCEENKSIQLTITAVGDDVDSVEERRELIDDVTRLLDNVMKVFILAAKRPIPFVPCPLCPTLHVLLSDVYSGDTIFCPHSNDAAIPTGYYSNLSIGPCINSSSSTTAHNPTAEKKLEVFTDYYSKLISVLPIKTLISHLVTKRLISFEEEEEIRQTQLQPSRLVLKKIASSLQAGLAYSFDELLLIMEQYGNISCVELASEIRLKLLEL